MLGWLCGTNNLLTDDCSATIHHGELTGPRAGLYPLAAMVNHDCTPNCAQVRGAAGTRLAYVMFY